MKILIFSHYETKYEFILSNYVLMDNLIFQISGNYLYKMFAGR